MLKFLMDTRLEGSGDTDKKSRLFAWGSLFVLFAFNLASRVEAYKPPSWKAFATGVEAAFPRGLALGLLMFLLLRSSLRRQALLGLAWGSGCALIGIFAFLIVCIPWLLVYWVTGGATSLPNYPATVFLWEELAKCTPLICLLFPGTKAGAFIESFLVTGGRFFEMAAFAAFAGLGFAIVENVGFLGYASVGHPDLCGNLTATVCFADANWIRTMLAPLTHPFYCLIIAAGIWLAVQTRHWMIASGYARSVGYAASVVVAALSFVASVTVHKYFNDYKETKMAAGPAVTLCVLALLAGSRRARRGGASSQSPQAERPGLH